MGEKRRAWDAETETLVERFRKLSPLMWGFELRPGTRIVEPVLFHRALTAEIRRGPDTHRARCGLLQRDLRDYLGLRKA